ncbi:ornithine cyclodeaminase family protein [Acidianus sulfidivorans JP7]|uniref:Ornithine cyclodeaminase n=1 Tax=Acidianus sulfidivorans JP7 TaxID=619593 RepID=A0A2U9INC7_9CREN|nr:ornithine cyclodeaminase family protein [Acidianus sulfidivorans]AWR97507.1 ornithine cyclodeaminase family protein [Acidianus sulfidivorans JP7]
MAILIREKDVSRFFTFKDAYEALREAFSLIENKMAINTERIRTSFSGATLTYQAGAEQTYLGFKTYIKGNFISMLFNSNGDLLLLAEADRLSQIRTGALAVLASDYIKKSDYSTVGIIGLGKQGLAQVEAFHELKNGINIIAYNRSKERIEKAMKILNNEGIKIKIAESYKDIFLSSEVVTSITSSKDPFIKLDNLKQGVHLNLMGSNIPERVEAYPEVIKAASLIAVEDINQALREAGDLILAKKMNMLDENKLIPLSSIISGKIKVNDEKNITIFKSTGIGLEDVAVMRKLYEKSKEMQIGSEIEVRGIWYRE